MSPMQELMGPF